MNDQIKESMPEGGLMNRRQQYAFYILPLVLVGLAFVCTAPPLDWLAVPGGEPRNPFARQSASGLIFNIRTVYGLMWYALAAWSFGLFIYRTKRFVSGENGELFEAAVFCLLFGGAILTKSLVAGGVGSANCFVQCQPF